MPGRHRFTIVLLLLLAASNVRGAEPETKPEGDKPEAAPQLVATDVISKLIDKAKASVVVITVSGRDGKQQGLGTGFVISDDGLIATNYHVIGEARPLQVQSSDGKTHAVTAIHAYNRDQDLAIVRIDNKSLPHLELGDSDTLKQGQALVALGNPLGLKYSVATGVLSGRREIDERPMLQLAMPVEPGNSGGPVLDLDGKAHGLVTMRSAETANLAFAIPTNGLKPLLEQPNPIPMSRWLTIGALDPQEWKIEDGARWRQHAGRITADGLGTGFGGRALCIHQPTPPELPYEATVSVKLDDETGAAGLICEVAGERHYGFYPSGGKLRFTRFDGATVYSWKILHDEAHDAYQPGEFNAFKVRVEKDRIRCFVNDAPVTEIIDAEFRGGRVGLAKFRNTEAVFKNFQVGKETPPSRPSAEAIERIEALVGSVTGRGAIDTSLIEKLAEEGPGQLQVLRDRARELELQAIRLRKLALAAHQERVRGELGELAQRKDDEIPLFRCGLLIAKIDNDELDVDGYLADLDRMAREIAEGLPKDADERAKLKALDKHLFADNGFHGSRGDYYNKSNSYLNEVLDDREGLPITLSVLYMELAAKLGVKVVGVGLPAHFIVRHEPAEGEGQLIDVYEGGKRLTRQEAARMVRRLAGVELTDDHLRTVSKRDILTRMVYNLQGSADRSQDASAFLRYVDTLVALSPDDALLRWGRARLVLRFLPDERAKARVDLDWLLEREPEGIELDQVRAIREQLDR